MRSLKKADKKRGDNLIDMGCIVCLLFKELYTPPEIHHIDGQTKEGCHQKTIGLCSCHHRYKSNDVPPLWISRHGDGRVRFEKEYGTEAELLEKQNELINVNP